MSTRRLRRAAARVNGKNSAGPVTPQPQASATRPALATTSRLAASICLTNENRADFIQLHEDLLGELAPATPFEHLLVEEIVVARWRQQRAWLIETYLIENQMDHMTDALEKEYVSIHEATRITLAFRELAEKPPALQMLQRYESRLSRQVERCRKQLKALRTSPAASPIETPEIQNVPNDPNPNNEHALDAAQRPESAPPAAQPVPGSGRPRPIAVTPTQSTPELAEFHNGSQRDHPETSPAPEGLLPRAA